MAADDRNFEKALARHLRAEAPAQTSNCADMETLAAYHERLLTSKELATWKEHIAGCARCQEILAQLEATEEIPVGSTSQEEAGKSVLVMPSSAQSARAAAESVARPRRSSVANWRYLVPAGAIAAGLLLFVVSREGSLERNILQPAASLPKAQPSVSSAESTPAANAQKDMARERAKAPAAEPKATLAAPAASVPAQTDELRGYAGSAAGVPTNRVDQVQRERDKALPDLRKEETLQDAQNSRSAPGPASRGMHQQSNNAVQQEPSLDQLQTQGRRTADLKQDAPAFDDADKDVSAAPATKTRALAKLAPAAPAPPPPPPVSAGDAVVGGAAGKKTREPAPENADFTALGAQAQTVVVASEANALLATAIATSGPRVLPVPGTSVIWKIDEKGRVQRSSDLGATWKVQDTGVNATPLSGAAPSEKVCWLVGTFGTVLLTTDSGAHWSKLTVPINSTIDRIEATDARHAVVTLQSTTVQFETFDAGQTWSLVKKK